MADSLRIMRLDLPLGLFSRSLFVITASVAGLSPRVDHLDLFDSSVTHHAIVGVRVGDETFHR